MVLVTLGCTKDYSLFQLAVSEDKTKVNVGCQKVIPLHDFKNHYP